MTRYATLDDLKAYKGIAASTTAEDMRLGDALDRASKLFREQTGYKWKGESGTRYYGSDDVDGDTLWLDEPLLSVTTLTNGDDSATTISSSYYWLWPRNTPTNEGYWGIKLKASYTYEWEQDTDCFISVAGVWGLTLNPPDDVVQAVIRWADYLYTQKDTGAYETTVFPESGVVTIPTGIPRDVQLVIDQRKRRQ